MAVVVRELLDAGLAHEDVMTVAGPGLRHYQQEPFLEDGVLVWRDGPETSLNTDILRSAKDPFAPEGGIRLLTGPLGRAVIKTSAVKDEHLVIEAPALVFHDQDDLLAAHKRGELNRDFIAVVRFQGPQANGMPELHSLTPTLGVLQDKGFKVALVTDGRMSGASGKVPAAIHVSPEAKMGGPLALVQDGDIIRLDARAGTLEVKVDPAVLAARTPATAQSPTHGFGREMFGWMRRAAGPAEAGGLRPVRGRLMKTQFVGLVGDIGGTNARLALVDSEGHIRHPKTYAAADYASLTDVIATYMEGLTKGRRLARAALAVAGPVVDGEIAFTNIDWRISEGELVGAFEFETARLLNDFAAQAMAAPMLAPDNLRQIGPDMKGAPGAPVAVLGAGTGFGVAGLARSDRGRPGDFGRGRSCQLRPWR